MVLALPFKDPDEILDYTVDWEDRLDGDTIDMSDWELVAGNPDTALVIDSDSNTDTTTTVWLSAGTLGDTYQLTNRIVTAGSRTMDQTVKIKIKAK